MKNVVRRWNRISFLSSGLLCLHWPIYSKNTVFTVSFIRFDLFDRKQVTIFDNMYGFRSATADRTGRTQQKPTKTAQNTLLNNHCMMYTSLSNLRYKSTYKKKMLVHLPAQSCKGLSNVTPSLSPNTNIRVSYRFSYFQFQCHYQNLTSFLTERKT